MTLEEALRLLVAAAERAPLPKIDHIRCEEAARILTEDIRGREVEAVLAESRGSDGAESG